MQNNETLKKFDNVGRIQIPSKMREKLNIHLQEKVKIYIEKNSIIIEKDEQECIFCGKVGALREFKDKKVCKCCEKEIVETRRW